MFKNKPIKTIFTAEDVGSMSGHRLDMAIASVKGMKVYDFTNNDHWIVIGQEFCSYSWEYAPSSDWNTAGELKDELKISSYFSEGLWYAGIGLKAILHDGPELAFAGKFHSDVDERVAICRVYVQEKMSGNIDLSLLSDSLWTVW